MSFDDFATAPIADLVEAAGSSGKVSLLFGAGASMEAGLPSCARRCPTSYGAETLTSLDGTQATLWL
jgi:hypothetical protein